MSQPNFLQVTNSLRQSVALCEAHPALSTSGRYRDALQRALVALEQATKKTDTSYTHWRRLLGKELLAFREARLDYDRTLMLADEHAMDDMPRKRIIYHEREALLALLQETVTWLRQHESEWPWVATQARALVGHIEGAQSRKQEADDAYLAYTHLVRERIGAHSNAVALMREFLREAGQDRAMRDALGPINFERV